MPKETSKKTIILVACTFIVPVILAMFALKLDWFDRGSTNKGQLLSPVRHVEISSFEAIQGKWLLIYQQPNECDKSCENALLSMKQVRLALGRELDRVAAVVLTESEIKAATSEHFFYPVNLTDNQTGSAFNQDLLQAIYIADPLGNVMLRYPMNSNKEEMIMTARDMLKDLKKMLKLSRIG